MVILTKKKFQFKNKAGDTFTTSGGMLMEEAPDWVTSSPLYAWALADGDVIVAKGKTDKDAVLAVAEAEETEDVKTEVAETEPAEEEPKKTSRKKKD